LPTARKILIISRTFCFFNRTRRIGPTIFLHASVSLSRLFSSDVRQTTPLFRFYLSCSNCRSYYRLLPVFHRPAHNGDTFIVLFSIVMPFFYIIDHSLFRVISTDFLFTSVICHVIHWIYSTIPVINKYVQLIIEIVVCSCISN